MPDGKDVRVKDSGERRDFGTGSVRDVRTGKGRYDLLPPRAIFLVARQFEEGAKKYGERNWEKGQPLSVYLDSAIRHSMNVSEKKDDERHDVAAAWNWLAFIETRALIEAGLLPKELDDLGITKGETDGANVTEEWSAGYSEGWAARKRIMEHISVARHDGDPGRAATPSDGGTYLPLHSKAGSEAEAE